MTDQDTPKMICNLAAESYDYIWPVMFTVIPNAVTVMHCYISTTASSSSPPICADKNDIAVVKKIKTKQL